MANERIKIYSLLASCKTLGLTAPIIFWWRQADGHATLTNNGNDDDGLIAGAAQDAPQQRQQRRACSLDQPGRRRLVPPALAPRETTDDDAVGHARAREGEARAADVRPADGGRPARARRPRTFKS